MGFGSRARQSARDYSRMAASGGVYPRRPGTGAFRKKRSPGAVFAPIPGGKWMRPGDGPNRGKERPGHEPDRAAAGPGAPQLPAVLPRPRRLADRHLDAAGGPGLAGVPDDRLASLARRRRLRRPDPDVL